MSGILAKKLARFKPGMLYAGVDLGLDRNEVKVIDERARQVGKLAFPHNQDGYDYFERCLQVLVERHGATGVVVGMEPTNYFWTLLAADQERRGRPYHLVNAFTVHRHREGDQLDRAKDDQRDAFFVAELLRTGKYTETRLLHGLYADLRYWVDLHDRLQRDLAREQTLIRNTVGRLFPELATVFNDFAGHTVTAMLRNHAAAAAIKDMPLETFLAAVRADSHSKRLLLSKLRQAHRLATKSVGLTEGIDALQSAIRLYLEKRQLLHRQLSEVRAALSKTFLALPEASSLLSVPGLGLISSATILAEIGNPQYYGNARQLIKLAGTQPTPNTSGRKSRSKTPMSHQGRPRLRTALYFACLRLIQLDDTFARDYRYFQHREHNPLCKMQALGALMNKLLRILWSLMRNHTLYQPALNNAA